MWIVGSLASEIVDGCQYPGLVPWLRQEFQQLVLLELGAFPPGELEGVDAAEQTEAIGCDGRAPESMLRTKRDLELRFSAGGGSLSFGLGRQCRTRAWREVRAEHRSTTLRKNWKND